VSRARVPRTTQPCEHCGQPFFRLPHRAESGRFCSRECAFESAKAEAAKRTEAKRRSKPRPWFIAVCETCGEPLRSRSPVAKRCLACAESHRYYVPRSETNDWVDKRCKECGEAFSLNMHLNREFCSGGCAQRYHKRNRRHRKRAHYVEPVSLLEIGDRDHWRCQLCGKAVARKQAAPRPRSPSLDHIVPIACGGTHEASNIQLAHFICNSRKGARAVNEQLLLVGR
jgi:hypothetical protein